MEARSVHQMKYMVCLSGGRLPASLSCNHCKRRFCTSLYGVMPMRSHSVRTRCACFSVSFVANVFRCRLSHAACHGRLNFSSIVKSSCILVTSDFTPLRPQFQQVSCKGTHFRQVSLHFSCPGRWSFHIPTDHRAGGIPSVGEMQNIYKGKQAEYEDSDPETPL